MMLHPPHQHTMAGGFDVSPARSLLFWLFVPYLEYAHQHVPKVKCGSFITFYSICREAGVLCPLSFHLRLHVNGKFFGVYALVEQVDDNFLRVLCQLLNTFTCYLLAIETGVAQFVFLACLPLCHLLIPPEPRSSHWTVIQINPWTVVQLSP